MYIILIAGFLGSGKTTFIRQLAQYLVNQHGKAVIIENEAGEVGIDDQFLAREGFQVKEVMGGCICCSLTADLTLAVNSIEAEFHPDWLVIETTGLAKPAKVIGTLTSYGQGIDRIYTVIIVDAGRWPELMEIMPQLISAQVSEADLVVVNKIDEIGPDGDLARVLAEIGEINGRAQVIPLAAAMQIEETIFRGLCLNARGGSEDSPA